MRKMINKKGFSLVELMIVVVIMGILIAVAIPLYGALTENAERKTCQDNQRTMRAMYASWVLMAQENDIGSFFGGNGKTSFNANTEKAEDVLPAEYIESFDDGVLPKCPVEGHYYVISKLDDNSINVQCYHNDAVDTDHTKVS